jgi:hypothetical protein
MPFGITNHFKGGTSDQYDTVVSKVHPPSGLPEGQFFHAAGAVDDGWIVIAIWDERASWDKFRDETLLPALQGLGDQGFPAPPEVTEFETHAVAQA